MFAYVHAISRRGRLVTMRSPVIISTLILSHLVISNVCQTLSFQPSYGVQPQQQACHLGRKQSPVPIDRDAVNTEAVSSTLSFVNYDEYVWKRQGPISYANKTVTVFADPMQDLHVVLNRSKGDALDWAVYQFHSMHFHWGCSEHTLFTTPEMSVGERGDPSERLELQFVHYNRIYSTFEQAKSLPEGLFVYAVIFRKRFDTNPNLPELDMLTKYVVDTNDASVRNLKWSDVFFYNQNGWRNDSVYFYEGSLNIYPCYESVLWAVDKVWLQISSEQVGFFRDRFYNSQPGLRYEERVEKNCRELQPLNNRMVRLMNYTAVEGVQRPQPLPPPTPPPPTPRPYRPGEGYDGDRLPPTWLILLIPAFIIGGLTYMHRYYDWSFLRDLEEEVRSETGMHPEE